FFFQAEDGIRDRTVTGVQTCALPISSRPIFQARLIIVRGPRELSTLRLHPEEFPRVRKNVIWSREAKDFDPAIRQFLMEPRGKRSEERRVGKSVEVGGGRMYEKKTGR